MDYLNSFKCIRKIWNFYMDLSLNIKVLEILLKLSMKDGLQLKMVKRKKIEQLVNKKKGKLTLDDWIMAMQTWGIPADVIAQVCQT